MAEEEDKTFLDQFNLKRLPPVLGENQIINMIKEEFFERKRHIEVPESKRLAPASNAIINAFCILCDIDQAQLHSVKRGTVNEAQNIAIYLLRYFRGDSLTAIGKVFDIQSYSTVSSIIERFKGRMKTDRNLLRKVEKIRRGFMRQGQT
jgi:chromosomal replication initiation ATPase DnaA